MKCCCLEPGDARPSPASVFEHHVSPKQQSAVECGRSSEELWFQLRTYQPGPALYTPPPPSGVQKWPWLFYFPLSPVLTLKETDQHGFVDSQAKWSRRASKVICFDFLRLSLCLHTSSDGELTNNQESAFIQIALKVILLLDKDLGFRSCFCHFLCSLRPVT